RTVFDLARGGVETHQGARECRPDPPRGEGPHASLPPPSRAAGQCPRVAELLRALLDQSPGCARATPPHGGRREEISQAETEIQEGRRQMNERANINSGYGTLIEPATLKIERLLPGPIERIWSYLTDGDMRRKWLAAGKMELKVGAPFELVWRHAELTDPPG